MIRNTFGEYKYLYETHLHTNIGSACGNNTGREMAKAAKEYGYAGIIVTEHNWGGNTAISRDLDWNDWIDRFAVGYEQALSYGKENDLDVFWGYEAGYNGTEFLIYGISPEWMKAHPQLRNASIEEQYELVSEAGGLVVHAHPYREEFYIPEIRLYPDYVHAVEGINATHSNSRSKAHNNPDFDKLALEYASLHNLPITAGSDIHSTNLLGGGVLTKNRLHSIHDYVELIKSGDYMLTNGEVIYDKHGKEVSRF